LRDIVVAGSLPELVRASRVIGECLAGDIGKIGFRHEHDDAAGSAIVNGRGHASRAVVQCAVAAGSKTPYPMESCVFEAKVHECSTAFRGDPDAAFALAKAALLAQGFEILPGSSAELRAEGPGMRSTQQSALLGVSSFRFQITASALTVSATLGGVRSMKAFVTFFPPVLILSLVALFALLEDRISYLGLGLLAPWLVISPLMAVLIERRTRRAVDRLARSMAVEALPD
jgi:hypothetical protein